MVMSRHLTVAIALISSLALPSCSLFQSENVTLCQEAMQINADQLKAGDEDRTKLIRRCRAEAGIHTPDQWKCIITEMTQGKVYAEAMGLCGAK